MAAANPLDKSRTAPAVRLIGLPTDSHSSFLRGAAAAPPLIRAALGFDHSNMAAESGVEIGVDIRIEDAGDLPLAEEPADDERICRAVAEAIAAGAVPLALGGDHSVSFPIVEAVAAAPGPVDILHSDPHPDPYHHSEGHPPPPAPPSPPTQRE